MSKSNIRSETPGTGFLPNGITTKHSAGRPEGAERAVERPPTEASVEVRISSGKAISSDGSGRRTPTRHYDAWPGCGTSSCTPQPYREFVNRWSTDEFRSYVGDLQTCVDRQLEACVGEQAREAEDAFVWVTHYERGFWDMAMSG